MKKVILGIVMLVSMITCYGTQKKELNTIKYEVVDTTHIYYKSFSKTKYDVTIKIDSSYYSAKMDRWGKIYQIDKKIK